MKQKVYITLDPETVSAMRLLKLNISEIAQEACDDIILAYCDDIETKSKSEIRAIQKTILKQLQEKKVLELDEMRVHIKAAKEAGIPRGKAESDFGHVFPDLLWERAE